jgi:hypothetical protein
MMTFFEKFMMTFSRPFKNFVTTFCRHFRQLSRSKVFLCFLCCTKFVSALQKSKLPSLGEGGGVEVSLGTACCCQKNICCLKKRSIVAEIFPLNEISI